MIYILLFLLSVTIDRFLKIYTVNVVKPQYSIPVIKDFLHLTYVENRGAAHGILQGGVPVFIVVTIIVIVGVLFFLIKYKPKNRLFLSAIALILGGAVGNLIDRAVNGFVVDMIEVRFIRYPLFNLADSSVVIGTVLLSIYILFIYKEGDIALNEENLDKETD